MKKIEKVDETAVPETALTPSAASPPALTVMQGEGEMVDYFGTDETSVTEVTIMSVGDDDPADALSAWEKKLAKIKPSQRNAIIDQGIEIARLIVANTNKYINAMHRTLAERAFVIGTIGHQLKRIVKDSDEPWVVWAEKNLGFIGRRNREKYMMLAKRVDCHPYAFLGIDRLEMLCSATKNSKSKDPIGELLRNHKIMFNPEAETNLADFKASIDAALGSEKLTKKGLNVDFNLVVNLIKVGIEVDNSLIKTLKNIEDCDGDPTKHLQQLVLTGGKDAADSDGAKNKPADFNSLSSKLIQTIDFLIEGYSKETVAIDQLDRTAYATLLEKLEELKKVANFTEDEDEEATE